MAYVYVRTQKEAETVIGVITKAHGVQPDVFRDGSGYRVQHNEIGSDAMREILRDAGLAHLADNTF